MSETKDTIYVDVDDEITDVVGKLKSSKHKIVALVLPKRAAMLQSTVNMRLLKRAAKDASKNIVLITSDHNLIPLAGIVGLHVAKSLQSKPAIPPIPKTDDQPETITTEEPKTEELDSSKSVGELADMPADDGEEVIEVDNEDLAAASAATAESGKADGKKRKGFKIPNFERFRLKFFLIALVLLLLIIGWVWGFVIAPKAKVLIKTDTSSTTNNSDFLAKTDSETLDLTANILPAIVKNVKKNEVQKVPATGEKNTGTKATGTMTVVNCTDNQVTVPAGTKFTNSSLSFASDAQVVVPASNFFSGGGCKKDGKKDVTVTAVNPGDNYNLSAGREYTSNFASTLTGTGSAMTGGTTQIVKVISEADIETAKQKTASNSGVAEELRAALNQEGFIGLSDTLSNENPSITASPKVGEEGNEVTVTIDINYTMIGVKETDLKQLIEAGVNKQIDTSRQKVADHGLGDAVFRILEKKSATETKVGMQTVVTIGPQIDENQLKNEIVGKKRGDVISLISSRPGVKEVTVDYSPFWVYSTPKSAKKITIIFEQTNAQP